VAATAYNSSGNGSHAESNGDASKNITWSHANITGNCFVAMIFVGLGNERSRSNFARTVTVGGVTMTAHTGYDIMEGYNYGWLEVFYLWNPPTGTQTVSVTVSGASGYLVAVAGESFDLANVHSLSANTQYRAVSYSPSKSVGSATDRYLVWGWGQRGASSSITETGDGTESYNTGTMSGTINYVQTDTAFSAGRTAGAASLTLSITAGAAYNGLLALEVVPATDYIIGSGACRYRSSTSTSPTISSGDHTFASGYFDGLFYESDDLTYTSSDNSYTVANSGWYEVVVVLRSNRGGIGFGVGGLIESILYVDGGVAQRGAGKACNQSTGMQDNGAKFSVFLKAGQKVAPGWASSFTDSGQGWLGDSYGQKTWWSIQLTNRSTL
jgi:hypothetical protein